jgi:hypothetical protein
MLSTRARRFFRAANLFPNAQSALENSGCVQRAPVQRIQAPIFHW